VIEALLVSGNPHKLVELRAILPSWRIEALSAEESPEETGATYLENARIKARFGRERAAQVPWVLGEDSGIECKALGGAPGLHSARWAPGRDQADALLERLAGEPDRQARMVSELVALSTTGEEFRGAGTLEGEIAWERRGLEGFGYDPIFVPRGYAQTVAEIGEDWKRRHSHRAQAALELAAALGARAGSQREAPA
jgi:XTP/dITP diphosphohydrolase